MVLWTLVNPIETLPAISPLLSVILRFFFLCDASIFKGTDASAVGDLHQALVNITSVQIHHPSYCFLHSAPWYSFLNTISVLGFSSLLWANTNPQFITSLRISNPGFQQFPLGVRPAIFSEFTSFNIHHFQLVHDKATNFRKQDSRFICDHQAGYRSQDYMLAALFPDSCCNYPTEAFTDD